MIGELVALFDPLLAAEEPISSSSVSRLVQALCDRKQLPLKALFHPLRYLLSGTSEGPGVPDLIDVLGKEETLRRIRQPTC